MGSAKPSTATTSRPSSTSSTRNPTRFLADRWLGKGKIRESELCRELGVKYMLITPDILPPNNRLELLPPGGRRVPEGAGQRIELPDPVPLQGRTAPHRPADRDLPHGVPGLVGGRGALRTCAPTATGSSRPARPTTSSSSSSRTTPRSAAKTLPVAPRRGRFGQGRGRGGTDDHHPRPDVPVRVLPVLRDRLDSLISLYVVIDLFTHLDAFVNRPGGFSCIAIISVLRVPHPAGVRPAGRAHHLMAATFTVAWMQRNNELLPQLSAGIPTRRVIRPILIGAAITLTSARSTRSSSSPRWRTN